MKKDSNRISIKEKYKLTFNERVKSIVHTDKETERERANREMEKKICWNSLSSYKVTFTDSGD